MSLYIPGYLSGSVERGDRGWPIGVEVVEQDYLILLVAEALRAYGGTAGLLDIHDYTKRATVRAQYAHRCPRFYNSSMWDYIYACLDRALRATPARATWTLDACDKTQE
jgi:hypothetical protein